MNPIEQNLNNLSDLWKKYGAVQRCFADVELYQQVTWPNRVWLQRAPHAETINGMDSTLLENIFRQIAPGSVLPVIVDQSLHLAPTFNWLNRASNLYPLLDKHQNLPIFELTAMHKKFDAKQATEDQTELTTEVIETVNAAAQLKAWIEITNEAFQYQVDPTVIQGLLAYPEVKLLLFYQHKNPVAGALLNISHNTIGIHQVGVKKSLQGQGFGLRVMQELLHFSANLNDANADSWVLQASKAGLPLYRKLGFSEQFQINHYWIAK